GARRPGPHRGQGGHVERGAGRPRSHRRRRRRPRLAGPSRVPSTQPQDSEGSVPGIDRADEVGRMSAAAAQFQFAAEFVSFLAAAGLTVVAIRRDLTGASRPARAGLAAGTLLLAAAAFAHGSLLVRHVDAPVLVAGRLVGAALLAAALVAWTGGAASRS